MRRISVVGCAGAGKSTLAQALADRLDVPRLELDSIFHLPGWQERPVDEFRADVAAFAAKDAWVVDGNYSKVQDLVWDRADTVVWLDLPKPVVMRAIVGRTLGRVVLRKELWNGNRESWRNLASRDPERSIILWAWTQHASYQQRYGARATDPDLAHLRWVRLRSRAEARAFLEAVPRAR